MPSISTEDYLKSIFSLQKTDKRVTTSSIAVHLQIAPASVTDMVKKLSEQGFLQHAPYRGVELTEKGRVSALRVLRKHRLWEMFLFQVLHFSWDEIHEEAEEYEHIMSDRMEDNIDTVLGHPSFDPHGEPIPGRDGSMNEIADSPLSSVPEGTRATVSRISNFDSELLQHAASLGIGLHETIIVNKVMKFDGSYLIDIQGKEVSISARMADSISVIPLS
jgi:DtxR family Mn-dependent transcriptional regulator